MLWLSLHLPWLPLEALPAAAAARCVTEQRRVLAVTRAARMAGVEPGMSTATAASLAPAVQQLAREPQREAEFVRLLALALARYTPQLVLQADGVLMEVAASLRLFGGLRSLLRQVQATARDCEAHTCTLGAAHRPSEREFALGAALRAHARLGLAPTAGAASLLARVPSPARRVLRPERMQRLLDALPLPAVLDVLQQPPRLAELLQAIGCRSVGDVRALPRAGLNKRGGAELLRALARAYGDEPDPRAWFEPPESFAMSIELMHRADDAAQLMFAAQRLVQALAGWLSSQWLAASRLRLRMKQERGCRSAPGDEPPLAGRRPLGGQARSAVGARHFPDGELLIELGLPSRDATQITTLLRERLQRFQLAAPVYAIELLLDEAVSSAGTAGRLLPDPGQQAEQFQALIDRLASRLDSERVQRLALRDDHRPERAGVAVSPLQPPSAAQASPLLQPRPVWLLPEPLRLPERGGQPLHGSVLTLLTRAERIEAGWFDGELVCRDYHIAEGDDHRLRWVFRARNGAGGEMAWYLHGLFA